MVMFHLYHKLPKPTIPEEETLFRDNHRTKKKKELSGLDTAAGLCKEKWLGLAPAGRRATGACRAHCRGLWRGYRRGLWTWQTTKRPSWTASSCPLPSPSSLPFFVWPMKFRRTIPELLTFVRSLPFLPPSFSYSFSYYYYSLFYFLFFILVIMRWSFLFVSFWIGQWPILTFDFKKGLLFFSL